MTEWTDHSPTLPPHSRRKIQLSQYTQPIAKDILFVISSLADLVPDQPSHRRSLDPLSELPVSPSHQEGAGHQLGRHTLLSGILKRHDPISGSTNKSQTFPSLFVQPSFPQESCMPLIANKAICIYWRWESISTSLSCHLFILSSNTHALRDTDWIVHTISWL